MPRIDLSVFEAQAQRAIEPDVQHPEYGAPAVYTTPQIAFALLAVFHAALAVCVIAETTSDTDMYQGLPVDLSVAVKDMALALHPFREEADHA